MNRNVDFKFGRVPTIDAPRSVFDLSHGHTSTCNFGEIVPTFCKEVLPGDSWNLKTSKVIRLQTLLTPIYGNLYADTYFFFVNNMLIWSHWKEFMGENTTSAWVPQVQYTVPTISSPSGGFAVGTIADHLGWPVNVQWSASDEQAPIALPLRAYAAICDSFFRDQNLTDPLNIPLGDSNQTGSNGSSYVNDVANGGMPFIAAKYHDYFTSCQPSPQKAAQPVSIGLAQAGDAPVFTREEEYWPTLSKYSGLMMRTTSGAGPAAARNIGITAGVNDAGGEVQSGSTSSALTGTALIPTNLYADVSHVLSNITINELRLAFSLQKYYERLSMSGSRYSEQLKAFFGVDPADQTVYRPEYLGGNRIPLNVSAVTNTAQTATDFLGDLGGKSETADIHADFVHSFSTHGWIIGVMVLRYEHTYAQGLDRQFKRKTLTQYYNPIFQTIGAQPVYTDELYADATNMATADVFGYNEAWSEYRFSKNYITGEMRPGIQNSLSSWHVGDYYTEAPTLSDGWIREDKTNVDRVLAVTSSVSNQAFYDIWFDCKVTRPLPIYSVPGLIDHH